jgi:hypothetical protein
LQGAVVGGLAGVAAGTVVGLIGVYVLNEAADESSGGAKSAEEYDTHVLKHSEAQEL